MTHPPPEPRPLVGVKAARVLVRTLHCIAPTWVLDLWCGHTVRRKSDIEPKHARCDECLEAKRAAE
jgi:hypothetical protein